VDDDIPYLLLTPGPLSTSRTVRRAMLRDWSTWDVDYNDVVNAVRARLVRLATERDGLTCVLMQGSGTFGIEAALGSLVPPQGKILVVSNGAYGRRMLQIADRLRIARTEIRVPETEPADPAQVERSLENDPTITHVAMVHCETTTGLLNPAAEVGRVARRHGKVYVVDAMSSFGGIPLSMEGLVAHVLVSSANKCIQGVPGFTFVLVERPLLEQSRGWARSLSLDLYDQWQEMERHGGKWRYTSPTHVVLAFAQALDELDQEGGVSARYRRYCANHERLLAGMESVGFRPLLPPSLRSPIITSFHHPSDPAFSFAAFYDALKARRFVIYPGKVSDADTFRIATIGHVFPADIDALTRNVAEVVREFGWRMGPPT
jgi:2-aminoethylphosphonate-pyruvate transaminase